MEVHVVIFVEVADLDRDASGAGFIVESRHAVLEEMKVVQVHIAVMHQTSTAWFGGQASAVCGQSGCGSAHDGAAAGALLRVRGGDRLPSWRMGALQVLQDRNRAGRGNAQEHRLKEVEYPSEVD